MADGLTINADSSTLLTAMQRLPEVMSVRCLGVAKVTSERIAGEARARVRRDTGETASHIVAEEAHSGDGYVVWVEPDVRISMHKGRHTQRVTYNALGGWIEFGTEKMEARPFLFNSARLEEGAHMRRLNDAAQRAIDETGLGD